MTKNGKQSHIMEVQYIRNIKDIRNVIYLDSDTYQYTQSLLWVGVIYLKDRSPYLNSSFPYSESQNTIKINLLGTYSTVNTYLKTCLSTLPSPNLYTL